MCFLLYWYVATKHRLNTKKDEEEEGKYGEGRNKEVEKGAGEMDDNQFCIDNNDPKLAVEVRPKSYPVSLLFVN